MNGGGGGGGGDAESDPSTTRPWPWCSSRAGASISAVQRQLRIGYNRAARLIEAMEHAGLVSPMQSNGNREVIGHAVGRLMNFRPLTAANALS